MTSTAARHLKHSLTSIFRRKGGDGAYTRLFDNLEPSQQGVLLSAISLRPSELPVIGSLQTSNDWLVLTTERLVWCLGGNRLELAVEMIGDATVDLASLQRRGIGKMEMRELHVMTTTDERHVVELEAGAPFFGAWNVLKNLGVRNRNATGRG
ncbi:hypothetical protein [Reyranella sp. CPCC 100927]|uniref:hypothetical protein n=1 Tax=Reyranella sp. CPCC 100927 TaxID=2599616 RepID=UPI0011B6ADA6|nr:hypothetical protein [Reyranella sp. CPCC 100927]TWT14054.1 hypothetical protein FQU96_09170 [Reyranella sp. CPCC 100927]